MSPCVSFANAYNRPRSFVYAEYTRNGGPCNGKLEAAMVKRDDGVREIVSGLEGLITLNEWENTLIRDLRDKAEAIARRGLPSTSERGENEKKS